MVTDLPQHLQAASRPAGSGTSVSNLSICAKDPIRAVALRANLVQQARACIYGHLKKHKVNQMSLERTA